MRSLREHLEGESAGQQVLAISHAIRERRGRAVLVGGAVRDALLGNPIKDLDVETYGLGIEDLHRVLSHFGEVVNVGKSFGVLMVRGLDVDFSLPRRDSKTASGHRGFSIRVDPHLSFDEASRRRDLTINSMGFDLLSGEILDPHGGRQDLVAGRLRATDPAQFAEDPLRALRVAQFAARFEMTPDPALINLCRRLDLEELPGERLYDEFEKMLLGGRRPSLGMAFLDSSGLIRFFPELAALRGVPQDPEWHPEGDVWIHTQMVLDAAARLRIGERREDQALMFGALCHDVGKPSTTAEIDGRVRSPSHDRAGLEPTSAFLERLRAPSWLVEVVRSLVLHHLAPALLIKNRAGPRAFRKLARQLSNSGASMPLLERLSRADHLGRTTEDALAGVFPSGERFLEYHAELSIPKEGPRDVVMGRHLIEHGLEPGKEFGAILAACRDVQDETGWDEPTRILEQVLGEAPAGQCTPDGEKRS